MPAVCAEYVRHCRHPALALSFKVPPISTELEVLAAGYALRWTMRRLVPWCGPILNAGDPFDLVDLVRC
jgi:hypothetical protein